MAKRNLELLSKIIFFYSLFYIVMKLGAIFFQDLWVLPNLILTIPFLIFAIMGGIMVKRKKFTWLYVISGIIIISIIRYYEAKWVVMIYNSLS